MKKLIRSLTVAVLVFGAGNFVRSDSEPGAKAIVERGIKAAGGAANLEKQKSATWKETGTYYGMGNGLPYTAAYSIQYPDKFSMDIQGVFKLGLNGDKGWIKTGDGIKDMTKDEVATQQRQQQAGWIASLWPLKDKAFELKALPEAKVGDAATQVVQVTRKDYPTVKLYFDKSSGLLIKSAFRNKAAELENKEVTMEVSYQKHQEVAGVQVPQKIVINRDGKLFVEAEMSDFRIGAKLDAKTFARPE